MNPRTLALFLSLSGAALVAGGCGHAQKPEGPVVRELKIHGAQQVDEGAVKEKILTAKTSWNPLARKSRFDQNVWNTDLKRIERYYRERGYYQARVTGHEVKPDGKDGVELSVQVEEGKPTFVEEMTVNGLDGIDEQHRKKVLNEVPLTKGQLFVEGDWEGLKDTVRNQLRELGYAEAKVNGEAAVDLETQRAKVTLEVVPGPRFRFGDVTVKTIGPTRVENWRVAEQAKEALEGETWYSDTARNDVQARVFRMGVFGAVKAQPLGGNPDTGLIPLEIEVQEAPFHAVRAGFGAGFEQMRNDAHVIAEYTHRDFLGGLRKLHLRGTAGYAFLPNAYTIVSGGDGVTKHGPIARLTTDLSQPRMFHPNITGLTRLEVERELEPAYSYYGGKVKLGGTWQPWTWLSITPSYNIELYQLEGGQADLGSGSPALLFGCPQTCVLSYMEQRVELDKRDDQQDPRSGYLLGVAFQQGGGFLGGSFGYLRVVPEARGYMSFLEDKRLTFSLKLRVGTLLPASGNAFDSPIVARFYSGGDQMRGFSTRRLAPMRLVEKTRLRPDAVYNAEALPIGGNGLFETQFEVRYSFTEHLRLATFIDTGFVTSESVAFDSARYFSQNALVALGAGLRYLTPIGPIRLDFAYRPDIGPPLTVYPVEGRALTYDDTQGCFGFGSGSGGRGGAPEGPCSLHISIGEAF